MSVATREGLGCRGAVGNSTQSGIIGRQFQPCPYHKSPAALTTVCQFEPCPYHWSPVEPCPYHRKRLLARRRGHPWRSSGLERGSEPATRTGASKITTCATFCRGAAQGPPSSCRGELGVSPRASKRARASKRRWVPRWTGSTRRSGRACTGGTAEPRGAVNRVGPAQARPRGLRDRVGSGRIGPGVLQPRGEGGALQHRDGVPELKGDVERGLERSDGRKV